MPHCSRCGVKVTDQAAYCHMCGSPQGPVVSGAARSAPSGGAAASSAGASSASGGGFSASNSIPGATSGAAAGATTLPQTGIPENVAGLLCYSLLWVTGLIFLLIDKRPFVKFHAAQSLITFGSLQILSICIGVMFGAGWVLGGPAAWGDFSAGHALREIIDLATVVLWIAGMVKAYQGERFRVPVFADYADEIAAK
jgi:uncharacterized membrane protein